LIGVGGKELAEVVWTVYGWSLFWGANRNAVSAECKKEFWGTLLLIDFFLILGLLKMAFYLVMIVVLSYIGC
jgi:hypothetical protein